MSGKNYSKAVEDIKSTVNIVDVIGSAITLKRSGSGYMACCPFHKEKTPSFSVSESKGFYHCFGCGEHGDVIKFVEKYYNLDFQSAVEKLCSQYGITIEETIGPSDKKKEEYYEANKQAARYFFDRLSKSANKGYDYMSGRGLTAKTLQFFGIGYTGEDWTGLVDTLTKNGVRKDVLLELGLAAEKNGRLYDKFRGRVIFPIINVRGKVIGFGGRIIGDGEPKYLNSPESAVYQKKYNLYGLNRSKDAVIREGFAILVEGYMDCVSLYQAGVENVAASCGTALTPEQAKLLKRYAKNIVLCYDSDNAGINAALRGIDVLREAGLDVRVLNVDDGKDPDEYIKKHGKDAFLDLMNRKAIPGVEYKVNILKRSYDLKDHTQGIKFLKELASVIKALSPVEADIYIQKYSKEFGISEGALRREVEQSTGEKTSDVPVRRTAHPEEPEKTRQPSRTQLNVEHMLIRLIMLRPSFYERIGAYPEAFVSDRGKSVIAAVGNFYKDGELDTDALKNDLSDEDLIYLDRIEEKIQLGEDLEKSFMDCLSRLESARRAARIEEIDAIIDMSDTLPEESLDQEYINKLLMEKQQLIIRNKGEN
ncbi:MAG: DNA primase [Firmicutes bacterium]|nr:DNA primase [Bacillota bacterium]